MHSAVDGVSAHNLLRADSCDHRLKRKHLPASRGARRPKYVSTSYVGKMWFSTLVLIYWLLLFGGKVRARKLNDHRSYSNNCLWRFCGKK